MVKNPLKADAVARIEAAIGAAEKSSRAEMVALLAVRASEYRATGLALAIMATFAAGMLVWAFLPWAGAAEVLLAEFVSFLALLALMELTPLGDRLTPRQIKAVAARRLARAAFLEEGLASTPERNGVLFFVSLAEHHIEIIADQGIDQQVATAEWQAVIDSFTQQVRRGEIEAGFVEAIEALAVILARHYPANGGRADELSNRLVVLG
ncbi:MAG: TPM domain-containing protein [Rhodospirillaceae bacterium]|nr:TPM domain-containing protein [Rhodospirillaceae bacterium]